ncbi:hypothetical protein GCM10009060_28420 [Halorubrum trapanicum]
MVSDVEEVSIDEVIRDRDEWGKYDEEGENYVPEFFLCVVSVEDWPEGGESD